ncbi:putative micronuclear linker histone polyprotein [Corchorus capsularis]|uniref:Putative micronuclear linker histone polyprotein n=1 Tax=Corchorus capsularis TaxID=210143 RepID=A0A1R3JND6_COCAP|nr:putative micronuclear linker histone polyprotein [Corchorus capsularis]
MGGISHKGNGNGGSNRGRPYGVMLLLAFGAALLGVMVLHKLRERRIFNLLVEEKNRQLISLQLLLQKEREYTKEMKKKAEEAKAKIYSLRNQKMELERRVLEMQSTIDSLRDEEKTMESALEEKISEIKLLRDKDLDSGNENPQVVALTATLKQKEAEIDDLKLRLESPVRVWSVSSDDPSNPPLNTTVAGSMEQKENIKFSQEEGGRVQESTLYKDGANPTKVQNGNETQSNFSSEEDDREEVEDGGEKTGDATLRMDMDGGQQLQKLESLGENASNKEAAGEKRNEDSEHIVTAEMNGENNPSNATETINNTDEQEQKGIAGEVKNPHQEGASQELQGTHRGGKRLEIDDNSRSSGLPGKSRHLSRTKGKRWRILARNRLPKKNVNSKEDGVPSIRSRRFSKEYRDAVKSREEGALDDEGKAETRERKKTKNNVLKHHNSEVTEEENAMSINHNSFLAREVPENRDVNGETQNYRHDDAKLPKVEETAHINQNMNSGEKDGMEEDMEDEDKAETEAGNVDLSSDFMSDSEDKEGDKEETDESEF